jgi:salicylate hydroxylase
MSSKSELEFAIIGGGIGGLSLGLALLHRGINVQVYEAAHHFGEIGAGVSFTPNAIHAMTICHPGIEAAFKEVRTINAWKSKEKSWFEIYDGLAGSNGGVSPHKFSVISSLGQNGVHRARFLDELIKAFPRDKAHFGKRLDKYSKQEDGNYLMTFHDGTTATAPHAVIGCDGIKSNVRASMFGFEHPCARPSYTHKFAYRGLIPMEDAIAAVGEEKALNGSFYWGKDNHCLTFAVEHEKYCNFVGFHTDPNDWPDTEHLTAPAHRADAERDLASFNDDVRNLIHLVKEDLDIWAIFDLGDNPPPAYARERVCLLGDAAHATSPHHGAGRW